MRGTVPQASLYALPWPAPYLVHDRYSDVARILIELSTPEMQDFMLPTVFFFK